MQIEGFASRNSCDRNSYSLPGEREEFNEPLSPFLLKLNHRINENNSKNMIINNHHLRVKFTILPSLFEFSIHRENSRFQTIITKARLNATRFSYRASMDEYIYITAKRQALIIPVKDFLGWKREEN